MPGVKAKPIKELDSKTKKTYFASIMRLRKHAMTDYVLMYQQETGKEVDVMNYENEINDGVLEFVFENTDRRAELKSKLKELKDKNILAARKKAEESSKAEIIKKNVIDEIDSFVSVMTKEEIEESINLMTAKKKELEEKEEKETYVKRFAALPIEEMKRLLDK